LPGWGPFPGPMFAPPGAVLPMPVYMGPPPHPHPHPPPPPSGTWPEMTPGPVPAQQKPAPAHYPNPVPHSPKDASKPTLARSRRADPPPINPAAASSPHYQNPGGFGGVYTPPTHLPTTPTASSSDPNANPDADSPTTSHYTNTKSQSTPLTTLTSSGRQFACGRVGCSAAFDRKSDCERHRRTHVKGAAEARPFRCGRVGCEAAFDRKDALMRHERNERTHLVRQTQPGRVKRPTRSGSRSDFDSSSEPPQPRRQSTRKRKSLLPSTADMYASDEDEDDEDEDDHLPSVKRSRAGLGSGTSRTGLDVGTSRTGPDIGISAAGMDVGPSTTGPDSTATDRTGLDTGTRIEDIVVMPESDDASLVIDPRLHGLRADEDYDAPEGGLGVETMQAVEAIQAALQQIEADADAEKGRVG
ncbi:hypothetical protein FRC06_009763, partial [Ceratobasidium sp. 370]